MSPLEWIDQAIPSPRIHERVAIDCPRPPLWSFLILPEQFRRWNPDTVSLHWPEGKETGHLVKRGLAGELIRYSCNVELVDDAGASVWALNIDQISGPWWLKDSSLQYRVGEERGGSFLVIDASWNPRPIPLRRIYGAVATNWTMRNVYRLKELAEGVRHV